MSDLIRREDAIKNAHFPTIDDAGYEVVRVDDILALPSAEPPYKYSEAYVEQIRTERDILQDMVNNMAEPKTGKWEIKTETDEYGLKRPKLVCSKCEKEPAAWDLTELFEFCPNCGARMRGEEE